MRYGKLIALCMLAASLASCQSNPVLVVNPHTGFEGRGDQCLRMRFGRVVPEIETKRVASPNSVIRFEMDTPADGNRRVLSFQLPFTATNDSDQPWTIDADSIALKRTNDDRPFQRVSSNFVVATIPPESNAKFYVMVQIEAPPNGDRDALLNGRYELVATKGGQRLLARDLSTTEVSQGTQMWRLTLTVVGLILVVGVL